VADLVASKPLTGFQDLLPAEALAFEEAVSKVKTVFRRYGYAPIDTPCIYRYETLTGGRAGIDKQLFEWKKKTEDGKGEGDHVALRFDLTVPLARYVAANASALTFPFKRYDVGKVWRGERPQKGRYREFYQCDFDVVGTTAPAADLEVALVMADSLDALGVEKFEIRLNDRQILNGLLASLGLLERSEDILRIVDKLDKIGEPGVTEELGTIGIGADQAKAILSFTGLSKELSGDELLLALDSRFASNEIAKKGVDRLRFVVSSARNLRPPERFKLDLSIARGLGYYTGTVYETFLLDGTGSGSICSGGRYDDLASYYTKQRLPGVGASIGISRLFSYAQKAGEKPAAPCPVLVITAPEIDAFEGVRVADLLRKAGIGAELYPREEGAKLGKQIKYGDARGHALCVIVAREISRNALLLKDMKQEAQVEVPISEIVREIQARLAARS
jgi:histidyl-tRNA synthetase